MSTPIVAADERPVCPTKLDKPHSLQEKSALQLQAEQRSASESSSETKRKKEWDLCVKKSFLNVGTSVLVAVGLGAMVAAADVFVILGTGVGVLWSVKTCRALMRDGIVTPEQRRAVREKKKKEEIERRQKEKAQEEEKAARRKTIREERIRVKAMQEQEKECCRKLEDIVKKLHECELVGKSEKSITKVESESVVEKEQKIVEERQCQDSFANEESKTEEKEEPCDLPVDENPCEAPMEEYTIYCDRPDDNSDGNVSAVSFGKPSSDLEFKSYTTVQLFNTPSKMFSTSVSCRGTKMSTHLENCVENAGSKRTPSDEGVEKIVTPANAVMKSRKSFRVSYGNTNRVDVSANDKRSEGGLSAKHVNWAQERPPVEKSESRDSSGPQREESEMSEDLRESESVDVAISEESGSDIQYEDSEEDVQLLKHEGKPDQSENEVIFVETCKAESWPFSFSLPSLDKFQKKTNSSFKWPPLTSSIIVKPKRSNENQPNIETKSRAVKSPVASCLCGSPGGRCTCP